MLRWRCRAAVVRAQAVSTSACGGERLIFSSRPLLNLQVPNSGMANRCMGLYDFSSERTSDAGPGVKEVIGIPYLETEWDLVETLQPIRGAAITDHGQMLSECERDDFSFEVLAVHGHFGAAAARAREPAVSFVSVKP